MPSGILKQRLVIMKKVLLILVLILTMINLFSQDVRTDDIENMPTVYDIQKNSLYVEYSFLTLSALYERSMAIGNIAGIIVGGGISQGMALTNTTNPEVKFAFIIGGYKHFFECGIAITPLGDDKGLLNSLVGYRYLSPGGFLLRFDINVFTDKDTDTLSGEKWTEIYPRPGLSIGYSF